MRRAPCLLFLALATKGTCLAQTAPTKMADPQNAPSVQNSPVSQSDPGWCAYDVEKRTLLIFPPKTFTAPTGQVCSVVCGASADNQTIQLGCDISSQKLSDGSICATSAADARGTIKIKTVEIVCQTASP